jgi:hypothetical protein
MMRLVTILSVAAVLTLCGCKKSATDDKTSEHNETPKSEAPAPTNRVDIPAAVRKNLGITFAKVERRDVARTLRLPGRFELLPTARREHRAAVAGRVELLVTQFQRVEVGTPLFRLDSPRWRELQEQISSAEAGLAQTRARSESIDPLLAAHEQHEQRLREKTELWTTRLAQLETLRSAGGGQQSAFTEARTTLADALADLAEAVEKGAELSARRREVAAELVAAEARVHLLLDVAASLTGIPMAELVRVSPDGADRHALWRSLSGLEIRAATPGIVEEMGVTTGAMVEASQLVLSTVQPDQLRFRASALQTDLGRLRDGLSGRIVPPSGGGIDLQDALGGKLVLGLRADPDERTVDLFVQPDSPSTWARAGVSAHLEVTLEGGGEELAIPLSCVTRDGTRPIIFRRDPANPDQAIRMDADIGINDGRWVAIGSGVKDGDEIVLNGVYQLMLATAGNAPKGGHFHSDGTFHEGEDK